MSTETQREGRRTCLAQHVGGNRDIGPDGRVDGEEDHPERHASPDRQVRKLQQRMKGEGLWVEIKTQGQETA